MKKNFISNNSNETIIIAQDLASRLTGDEVICLYGDLGSGKTVFAKGIIQFFIPNQRILSPTFIIVRHYQTVNKKIKNIYHADLYRIEKEGDLDAICLNEFIGQPDSIVIIEWAERLGKFLPQKRIDTRLRTLSDYSRLIIIEHINAIA